MLAFGYLSDDGDGDVPSAVAVPGFDGSADPFENAGAVAALVGADVAAVDGSACARRSATAGSRCTAWRWTAGQGSARSSSYLSGRWPEPPPTEPSAPSRPS